jgi:hypothetical protein
MSGVLQSTHYQWVLGVLADSTSTPPVMSMHLREYRQIIYKHFSDQRGTFDLQKVKAEIQQRVSKETREDSLINAHSPLTMRSEIL